MLLQAKSIVRLLWFGVLVCAMSTTLLFVTDAKPLANDITMLTFAAIWAYVTVRVTIATKVNKRHIERRGDVDRLLYTIPPASIMLCRDAGRFLLRGDDWRSTVIFAADDRDTAEALQGGSRAAIVGTKFVLHKYDRAICATPDGMSGAIADETFVPDQLPKAGRLRRERNKLNYVRLNLRGLLLANEQEVDELIELLETAEPISNMS